MEGVETDGIRKKNYKNNVNMKTGFLWKSKGRNMGWAQETLRSLCGLKNKCSVLRASILHQSIANSTSFVSNYPDVCCVQMPIVLKMVTPQQRTGMFNKERVTAMQHAFFSLIWNRPA